MFGPLAIRVKGRVTALAAAASLLGLCGCSLPNWANPIEWYRDATGVSKNDGQGGTRNTANLAAGAKEPYPNLATVPPPPDRATSAADRKALADSLSSDRAAAKQSAADLRAANPATAPAPHAAVAIAGLAGGGAKAGAGVQTAGTAPASATAAPGATQVASASDALVTPPGPSQHKPPVRNSESPPEESTLTAPTVPDLPEGDLTHSPPPVPSLAAPGAPPTPSQSAATPQPRSAPDVPTVPPPAGGRATPTAEAVGPEHPLVTAMAEPQSANAARGAPSAAAAHPARTQSQQLAEIEFTSGETQLSAADNERLSAVVSLFQENGGTIRIVGYGRRGYGPDAAQQELQSFSKAIDRANAIAQALAKLGIPANNIVVQAAPIGDGLGEDRAEIMLEH
jgi:outer membrane protein OmpA-like peptidoglycan-associated protein